jgi:hypothetical protein
MEVSSEEIPATVGKVTLRVWPARERHFGEQAESANIHFLKKNNVILALGAWLPVGKGQSWFSLR